MRTGSWGASERWRRGGEESTAGVFRESVSTRLIWDPWVSDLLMEGLTLDEEHLT